MKTKSQLQKDYSLAIKAILTDLETVAALDPVDACHPVYLDEVRHRVMRRMWDLFKMSVRYGNSQ